MDFVLSVFRWIAAILTAVAGLMAGVASRVRGK